jgi:hypothetical protein
VAKETSYDSMVLYTAVLASWPFLLAGSGSVLRGICGHQLHIYRFHDVSDLRETSGPRNAQV